MTVVGIVFGGLIVRIMMKDIPFVLIIPERKIQMTKIILKNVSENKTQWFCGNCNEPIYYVPETIASRPLIDICPHCGVTFTNYELCKSRIDMNNRLISEFPELARVFDKENKE